MFLVQHDCHPHYADEKLQLGKLTKVTQFVEGLGFSLSSKVHAFNQYIPLPLLGSQVGIYLCGIRADPHRRVL